MLFPSKLSDPSKNNERGNVLFLILIVVALFGALSFAVGTIMQGGNTEAVSEQNTEATANEILDYARVIRQGIKTIQITNGCQDTEINFNAPILEDAYNYENPNAQDSGICDVFSPDGAGINYRPPDITYFDGLTPNALIGKHWFFAGTHCVKSLGGLESCSQDTADLIMFLPNLADNLCRAVNSISNVTSAGDPIPSNEFSLNINDAFTGEYSGSDTAGFTIGFNEDILEAQSVGCARDSSGQNIFYHVLIAR